MTIDKFEPRRGGSYRYIHTDKEGNRFAFHGVFHELYPAECIIQTFEYEGLPEKGHTSLDAIRFEKLTSDKCKVTMQSVFQTVADPDAMLKAGNGNRNGKKSKRKA